MPVRQRWDYDLSWQERFWSKVFKGAETDCWDWTGTVNDAGRPVLCATRTPHRSVNAHRYSYWLHNGKPDDGLIICHKCDRPKCVNPDHLYAGTVSDNMQDCIKRGRRSGQTARGERCHLTRHSNEKIALVRSLNKSGIKMYEIAKITGIHPSYVSRLVRNIKRTVLV